MKKIYKNGIYLIVAIICVVIILKLFSFKLLFLKEIINIIVLSFIASIILKPLLDVLVNKGVNKKLATVVIIFILMITFVSLFVYLIPAIFRESSRVQSTLVDIESYIVEIEGKLKLLNNKIISGITNDIYNKANSVTLGVFNKIVKFILIIGDNLISFLVVPIVVYYFLTDGKYIKNKCLGLFPCSSRRILNKVFNDLNKVLKNYFFSQFILCLIIGSVTFILLSILGIQFPILLSIINGALNVVPYFGPIIGIVPIFIVALLKSKLIAFYSLIGLLIIQQIEGNILAPKITGNSVSMHPLTVIILLIVGSELAGFWGMVLVVPITVTLKVIYDNLNYYLF